jgi:quercetin dioxygenase-like cupin family protein
VTDGDFRERLVAAGLSPGSWANRAGDRYAVHDHGYDKVIVVAAGSIAFGLPDLGRTVELITGDRLDLPAGTRHDAVVGPSGVACLEAHAPAGSLGPRPEHRPGGSWT